VLIQPIDETGNPRDSILQLSVLLLDDQKMTNTRIQTEHLSSRLQKELVAHSTQILVSEHGHQQR
jgi:hypothetical protein